VDTLAKFTHGMWKRTGDESATRLAFCGWKNQLLEKNVMLAAGGMYGGSLSTRRSYLLPARSSEGGNSAVGGSYSTLGSVTRQSGLLTQGGLVGGGSLVRDRGGFARGGSRFAVAAPPTSRLLVKYGRWFLDSLVGIEELLRLQKVSVAGGDTSKAQSQDEVKKSPSSSGEKKVPSKMVSGVLGGSLEEVRAHDEEEVNDTDLAPANTRPRYEEGLLRIHFLEWAQLTEQYPTIGKTACTVKTLTRLAPGATDPFQEDDGLDLKDLESEVRGAGDGPAAGSIPADIASMASGIFDEAEKLMDGVICLLIWIEEAFFGLLRNDNTSGGFLYYFGRMI
tara:strand:- start:1005 stop:2012 length:1008 start_codon:yes stop_codon:yes gene_type:complete